MKKSPYATFIVAALFALAFLGLPVQAANANDQFDQLLKQHQGKVIYVDFWASWCGPCRKSFPWMDQMQQKYGDKNFTIIAINVDKDKSLADKFLLENAANFPIVFDPEGKLALKFNVKGMPSSYLLNAQGKLIRAHTGFFTKKIPQYEQELANALATN